MNAPFLERHATCSVNCRICCNISEDNEIECRTDLARLIYVVEKSDSQSESSSMHACLLLCTGPNQHLKDLLRSFSYIMDFVSLEFVSFVTS